MKEELLYHARDLDKVMRQENINMKSLNSQDHEIINQTLFKSISNIWDVVVKIIRSYDKNSAIQDKYHKAYNNLIQCWDSFTSDQITPKEAGERLEKVRLANLNLIESIENNTRKSHLRLLE